MTDDEFAVELTERVEEREAQIRQEMRAKGRKFLGRRAVLRQSWRDTPRSREERGKLSPQVAAKDKWRRIEALARNQRFREWYREARKKLLRRRT